MALQPHPVDLRAGVASIVGSHGKAIVLPDGDFETYSEAGYIFSPDGGRSGIGKWDALPGAPSGPNRYGLGCVGAASYTEHPSAEVLSFFYNLKDGAGRQFWRPGMPNPAPLFDHIARGGLFEAWNVAFERWVWLNICQRRYGWPAPPPVWQLRCAMGKARAYGLPGALGKAGGVLQLQVQKDADGGRLLDKFSKPRNPTKTDRRTRIQMADDPADALRLYAYNEIDIISESEASARVPDLEGEELEFWQCDFAMNARGVQVDTVAIANCIAILEQAETKYNAELRTLTAGAVERASELAKFQGWLGAHGVHTEKMDEATLANLLKQRDRMPPHVARAIEVRRAIGSASVKKVFSMRNQATFAGRLHDLFSYHAARTGRVTGNGPQPTNLPKEGPDVYKCAAPDCGRHYAHKLYVCPWCTRVRPADAKPVEWCVEAVQDALNVIAGCSLELLELYFVDALATISGCLRGLFIAAPGCDLVASDFNSIEAVVLAMIAGEQWRIEVFRTHGKIYEMGASKITGIPFQEYLDYKTRTGSHHPTRAVLGKISELASGYGGWIGAWRRFIEQENAKGKEQVTLTDDEIKTALLGWRAASPSIVHFWGGQYRETHAGLMPERFGCEGMAINAVMEPGTRFGVKRLDGSHTGVSFVVRDDILGLRLPSGREIAYHRPRLERSGRFRTDWSLSYEGWNTNPLAGPIGWVRLYIYGGKWVENISQATARDVLRYSIINLERAGYPVVMQVYDEIVAEVMRGTGDLGEFERIMATMPPWARDWPIRAAGGWRGHRYRKG